MTQEFIQVYSSLFKLFKLFYINICSISCIMFNKYLLNVLEDVDQTLIIAECSWRCGRCYL